VPIILLQCSHKEVKLVFKRLECCVIRKKNEFPIA